MTRAIAFTQTAMTDWAPLLRALIVSGCGLSLVLAGQPLPI